MDALRAHINRARYESFGGIVSCEDPPFLAWVDRDFMRDLGYEDSPLWRSPQGYLSAPTEVHFAVTGRCSQGCDGCYTASGENGARDLPLAHVKRLLRTLRDMGVFHVALGGGEAFERPDFGEIVTFCREIGLVPNLTTNGQRIGESEARLCARMGQVNISLDGVGERYSVNARRGSFEKAHRALDMLQRYEVTAGMNCVVSSRNFEHLEEVVAYGAKRGLNEIEFLKYKPAGRASARYDTYRLSDEMLRSFYPRIESLGRRYDIELKVDCSFIPALVYHRPPVDVLEKLAVAGCDGGNLLMSVDWTGKVSGCSFVAGAEDVSGMPRLWHTSAQLNAFRSLVAEARRPCRDCDYLRICKCGFRAVALHESGDFFAPDPECPLVRDYERAGGGSAHRKDNRR